MTCFRNFLELGKMCIRDRAQALAWDPAAVGLGDYLSDECTGKPGSSMGDYWQQTRLGG